MASIFKQQYTAKDPKTGKRVKKKSQYWYIDFKAAGGIRKRVKGFRDKTATAQLAAKLEKEAELAESGIIDRFKEHRKAPLTKHLEDWRNSLIACGVTLKQADQNYRRALRILTESGLLINFKLLSGERISRPEKWNIIRQALPAVSPNGTTCGRLSSFQSGW